MLNYTCPTMTRQNVCCEKRSIKVKYVITHSFHRKCRCMNTMNIFWITLYTPSGWCLFSRCVNISLHANCFRIKMQTPIQCCTKALSGLWFLVETRIWFQSVTWSALMACAERPRKGNPDVTWANRARNQQYCCQLRSLLHFVTDNLLM